MTKIGLIVGSGADSLLDSLVGSSDWKPKSMANRYGRVCYVDLSYDGVDVVVALRHGTPEGKELHRDSTAVQFLMRPSDLQALRGYEAIIHGLREAGVEAIYATSAVGSFDVPLVDKNYVAIPDQYVRGLAAGVHSFDADHVLEKHPSLLEPFDLSLRKRLADAVERNGWKHVTPATYIFVAGNVFETPAEIRMLDRMTRGEQGRVLGMTTVPEAILCAEIRMPYAAVCAAVDDAHCIARKSAGAASHEQTLRMMRHASDGLNGILRKIVEGYR